MLKEATVGDCRNALDAAAWSSQNDLSTVEYLISKGADIHAQSGKYETPLHVAVRSWANNLWMVAYLVKQGSGVNARAGKYETPLITVASTLPEKLSVVKYLIGKGADVNAKSEQYGNVLGATMRQENRKTARLLLSHGAKLIETDEAPLWLTGS
jgi:ankyrin repeat protein